MKTIDVDAALRRHTQRQRELELQAATKVDSVNHLREHRKSQCRCPYDSMALTKLSDVREGNTLVGYELGCPKPSCHFTMVIRPGTKAWRVFRG